MIRKILFIVAILFAGTIVAQNLTLNDKNDNSIGGLTYYVFGTGFELAGTEFHVINSAKTAITFDAEVTEITNPMRDDWQVCFGSACYSASGGVSTTQSFSDADAIALSASTYTNFKVGPFSFSWLTGDYGRWMVKVVNSDDVNDFSEACVVWTLGGSFAGDQNNNMIMDANEIAGDIDNNGLIDGNEILGDMDGSGAIDPCEISGDANGNGIIDGNEVTSIFDYSEDNVMFNTYPNPVSNQLNLKYTIEGELGNARIDVYDVLGQEINTYKLSNNQGELNLDVNQLVSGVYFYAIRVNEKIIRTQRVMIQ